MKKLFSILLIGLLAFSSSNLFAQKVVNRNPDGVSTKILKTTDSAFTSIDSAVIQSNEVGFIEVEVVGLDLANTKAVTGKLLYRYKSFAGTITLASANTLSAIVTDSGLSPATFQVIASGSKLYLQLKGKNTVTINWCTKLKRTAIYR